MFTVFLSWITAKWASVLPYVIGGLGIVAGLFSVRQSGKNAAYAEIAKQTQQQTNEALNVTQAVNNLSDTDVVAKLHDFYR